MENQEKETSEVEENDEVEENRNVLDQVEEEYQDQQVGGKENNGPDHGSATGGRNAN